MIQCESAFNLVEVCLHPSTLSEKKNGVMPAELDRGGLPKLLYVILGITLGDTGEIVYIQMCLILTHVFPPHLKSRCVSHVSPIDAF